MNNVSGIGLDGNGIAQSINAMQLDMDVMGIFGENIVGFDKIGYQRKDVVISSFAEYIGPKALSSCTDNQVGRLFLTDRPLDIALSEKGYFNVLNENGTMELTRDGRFNIDKDGYLLTLNKEHVLSSTGSEIKLPFIPEDFKNIKIGLDGKISVFNEEKRKMIPVATIGVVNEEGRNISLNCVRQGYLESSNVSLDKEYIEIAGYKRNFSANKEMFKIQNDKLSSAISRLSQV